MSRAVTGEIRRVLLAVEAPGPGAEHLSAAGALAELLGAELAGLFIEDVNLLRVAALPFTQEVGRVSGAVRPLEVPEVERQLKRQAEQARRALEASAQELKLPWSFQIGRGTLLEALETSVDADVAVVAARPRRVVRQPAARTARGGHVVVLFDASAAAFRALEAAAGLAQRVSAMLSLVIPAATEAAFDELREAARRAIDLPTTTLKFRRVGEPSVASLRALATRPDTCAVVLWSERLAGARGEIRLLIEQIDCPLVLVR